MAKNSIFIIEEDEETFVDESGKTSLEPEGTAGHHSDWKANGPEVPIEDRAEEEFDFKGGNQRGLPPVEGDGSGSPD